MHFNQNTKGLLTPIQEQLISLLKEEVVPAMGCTEPVAVALAVAKAKSYLKRPDRPLQKLAIEVSPNIYKNGLGVGVPGTQEVGLMIAAQLGYVLSQPPLSLEVLSQVTEKEVKAAHKVKHLSLDIAPTSEKIYINVRLNTGDEQVSVTIQNKHTQFTEITYNQDVIYSLKSEDDQTSSDPTQSNESSKSPETLSPQSLYSCPIKSVIKAIEDMPDHALDFCLDGLYMNQKVAQKGLQEKCGMGVGYGFKNLQIKGYLQDDLMTAAMMLTASGSDARMSGIKLPVMSSNGSGNNGLTALLPIVAYAEKYPTSDDKLAKATAMSHFINGYIKNAIGRLSAICGCGVAAGTGASVAITWLMGGGCDQMAGAIHNMLANTSGMICDGAKVGCSLKLATSASAAIQSATLALQDIVVPAQNGLIGHSVEESIDNLHTLSSQAMQSVDETILKVMQGMQ